jgi:hypothetical protein
MSYVSPFAKPSRTKRVLDKRRVRLAGIKHERDNKGDVRRRDRGCRFPLCGCRRLGLRLEARQEVSHDKHKGMGGNPDGDRSVSALMVQLCLHRHQDSRISRHRGTMRARPLTRRGYNGPVIWEADRATIRSIVGPAVRLGFAGEWFELARESAVGRLEALTPAQADVLAILAKMEC